MLRTPYKAAEFSHPFKSTDIFSTFRHGYDQIGSRGGANTTANGAGGVIVNRNQYRASNSKVFLTATKRFSDFSFTGIIGNEFQQIYAANVKLLYGV